MKNLLLLVALLFIAQSCTRQIVDNLELQKKLIGTWKIVDGGLLYDRPDDLSVSFALEHNFKTGYNFKEDWICEEKQGFFSRNPHIVLEGFDVEYQIKDSTLIIFDGKKNEWDKSIIRKLTADTLLLTYSDSTYAIFKKIERVEKPFEFDDIIVSSSSCYGSCPINDVYIKKTGEVFYNGVDYNTKNGFFRGKIDSLHFVKLKEAFAYIDIDALKDEYVANWTDDQTIWVSFIKDGKRVKLIEDYGQQSPTELQWAVLPLRFLYQQIELIEVENKIQDSLYQEIRSLKGMYKR